MHSFLKWPGSKREQRQILTSKLPLSFNTYIEPFVGGGSLFLHLALKNVIINDINKQLINCYLQIKNNVKQFIAKVKELDMKPINNDYYLQLRDQYNIKIQNDINDLECAALMYWLNKRCFNGLYRVNKKGLFNASWNKSTNDISLDESNLLQVSKYLSTIKIYNQDYEDICKLAKPNDFIYIDSPYAPVSDSANFTSYNANGFSKTEHFRLANIIHELTKKQVYVMASNHNIPFIRKLYKDYNFEIITATRKINTDASKRTGTEEIIITNY